MIKIKIKIKTLGLCPKPRKLFEKSLIKNFGIDIQMGWEMYRREV